MPPYEIDPKIWKQSLARGSLAGFILYTDPQYQMSWCHEEICAKLDQFLKDVEEKKSPRLMISMPPRAGKTEIASRRFPAYAFGRNPKMNIIAASYSADLASRNNRDVQRIMSESSYHDLFPDVVLPKALGGRNGYIQNNDMFEVMKYLGSYRSAGVGGGITGMGGQIMIVDDPLKDRAEADSPTIREKLWDWYTSTFYTRLAPGGGVLVIATRWHMDDLTGRLLEAMKNEQGDRWDIVDYPAIATQDELHRKKGEALHPERYPLEQLLHIKAAIGTRDWEALYQQHPTVEGGAIIKQEWIRTYNQTDLPREFDQMIASWDMTFKEGNDKDYVAGQVWGRKGSQFYLLDQVRKQMDFVATCEEFIRLSNKWPKALKKLIEDKANGPAVISMLKKQVTGLTPVQPDGTKIARAYAITPLFEAGNVFVPNPTWCPWARAYIDELLQFPSGAHDDQVDATTQALREFTTRTPMKINPAVLRVPYPVPMRR